MKRAQAAIVGMMLIVAGCGGAPATPVSTVVVAPSSTPTAGVSAPPVAAATSTPAAATVQPAASSTPQPSAAATAKPTAAAATPAVKETAAAPAATPASASAAPSPSAKPDGGTSTAAQAQVLYKDNCMSCHGAGLAGDFGPNLTKVGSRKTKDEIVTQILGGKGDMPPFKSALKSEEIEVLAAWLADKK
ncbi:c-type cytochrome [Paenibacillus alginolyticus]|uniref:Cytochrome c n=1 Tax=Paenibacillus alginolyticus TaxID=59839 RepID=A0ABT4GHW0_9BACL|nr:cytochrome c [Paenibacillus alginolyticus]MCY9695773.1 cytochrome c [Paenibacillus alginolyticus]MEC0142311.1 cytochrome c [Paenibacillus alginolyticus]